MKTVSTKLDNKLHNQFIELCNGEGKCQSEFLRDIIEDICENCSDEGDTIPQDLEFKDKTDRPKPTVVEILD